MAIDQAREDRARQLAAAHGLQLMKSPSRNPGDDNYAPYVLTHDAAAADSAFDNGYGMTLLDVERALNA
jgi:hypothetical protein